MSRPIALECGSYIKSTLEESIVSGGGELVPFSEAEGLIFARAFRPDRLGEILDSNHEDYAPKLEWIQLPYAGIEPFVDLLTPKYIWTCGKGIYAPPVAEMALALLLAGFRRLNTYAQATTWKDPIGENLIGATIVILGGGGICEELVKLLVPFNCKIHVVRKHKKPLNIELPSTTKIEINITEDLPQLYEKANAVVLALSLTPETENIIDAKALKAMPSNCWIINVARGKHINTPDLVSALQSKTIGGAGLDVIEPEPLPDDHPLWKMENCIITPHTANTPEMGIALFKNRIEENIKRFCSKKDLLGGVSVDLGY